MELFLFFAMVLSLVSYSTIIISSKTKGIDAAHRADLSVKPDGQMREDQNISNTYRAVRNPENRADLKEQEIAAPATGASIKIYLFEFHALKHEMTISLLSEELNIR